MKGENTMKNSPIYLMSAQYARQHNEIDKYRESMRETIACKDAIEKAIARNFDGMRLARKCLDEVIENYSITRIAIVLAATLQVKDWDGRFSSANKAWAKTIVFPDPIDSLGFDRRDKITCQTHPAVLDGFINLARQKMKEVVA